MGLDQMFGNAGAGMPWRGHTAHLLDMAALTAYEVRVFGHHFAALQAMRAMYSEEAYERALYLLGQQKAAGLFGLKGRIGSQWATTPDGISFLVTLILDPDGKKGLDGWAVYSRAPADTEELVQQVMKDSGIITDELLAFSEKKQKERGAKAPGPAGAAPREEMARPFQTTRPLPGGP